jgi:hypothetical protein
MENFKDGGFELFLGLRREGIVKINYPITLRGWLRW